MKLFIVIPTIDGSLKADTFVSLWRFCRLPEVDMRCYQWNHDIVRVRNRAVYEFLRTDQTHLFFVDADVGFAPEVPVALYRSGFDFCAATYPKKKINWEAVREVAWAAGEGVAPDPIESPFDWPHLVGALSEEREVNGSPFKAAVAVPMGCTMLSRAMLETLTSDCITYGDTYAGKTVQVPALFNLEIHGDPDRGYALLPEDYSFSAHARRHGFQPWVLLDPICTHTGSYRFDVRETMAGLR